jgi:hypothetical protein
MPIDRPTNAKEGFPSGNQDRGTEWLKLDHPKNRPWEGYVNEFYSEKSFQRDFDSVIEFWEEQALSSVEDELNLQKDKYPNKISEQTKEAMIGNLKLLIVDEARRMYASLLEKGEKPGEIKTMLTNEGGRMGCKDIMKEVLVKQLLIEQGAIAGIQESNPSEMMNDDTFMGLVKNSVGEHFYSDGDRISKLHLDKALMLKAYASSAHTYAALGNDRDLKRVAATMSEISLQKDVTATDDRRDERSALIEKNLRGYYGEFDLLDEEEEANP